MWLTWYDLPGKPMANHQLYQPSSLTLASNHFQLGTILKITNTENGRVIFAPVTDRTAKWVADANRIDGSLAVWRALNLNLKRGKVLVEVYAFPYIKKDNRR